MTEQDHLLGKTINGYAINGLIGRGGMATVYKATQMSMNRTVALKVLPRQFVDDDTYIQRFNREVEIVSRLEHRCIVPVYDYGEYERQPFIAMRYMPDGSIDTLLMRGAVPIGRTVDIIRQVAPALDYAHSKNVLHRDLKPSNILLDDGGGAYITDFGIARILGEAAGSTITTQGVVGTPAYMSPEQAQGKPLDSRSDVYSLGVMLFEMLTGKRPFQGDTPYGVAVMQVTTPPPQPRSINPALPGAVEQVIYKALSKNPDTRYQTAVALAKALERAVEGGDDIRDTQPRPVFRRPEPQPIAPPSAPTAMPQTFTPPPYSTPANQPPRTSEESAWMPPVQPAPSYPKLKRRRPPRSRPLLNLMLGGLIGCALLTVLVAALAVLASNLNEMLDEPPPAVTAQGSQTAEVPVGGIMATVTAPPPDAGIAPQDIRIIPSNTPDAPATPIRVQVTVITQTPNPSPGVQPPGVR